MVSMEDIVFTANTLDDELNKLADDDYIAVGGRSAFYHITARILPPL